MMIETIGFLNITNIIYDNFCVAKIKYIMHKVKNLN